MHMHMHTHVTAKPASITIDNGLLYIDNSDTTGRTSLPHPVLACTRGPTVILAAAHETNLILIFNRIRNLYTFGGKVIKGCFTNTTRPYSKLTAQFSLFLSLSLSLSLTHTHTHTPATILNSAGKFATGVGLIPAGVCVRAHVYMCV
jgi:hypothetical protein